MTVIRTLDTANLGADIEHFGQEAALDLEPWSDRYGTMGSVSVSVDVAGDAMSGEIWSGYGHPEECLNRDDDGVCTEPGTAMRLATFTATSGGPRPESSRRIHK